MIQPFNQFLFMLDEMGIFGGVLITLFAIFIGRLAARSALRSVGSVWVAVVVAGMFNTLFGCYEFSCGNFLIGTLLGITMRMDFLTPPSESAPEKEVDGK